jgi:hypothetical protein
MTVRRKSHVWEGPAGVNVDPLMDVITCVVGIMLFVVIFAVLEAGGSRVEMVTPRLTVPPTGSTRRVFLCEAGRLRELRIDTVTDQLLAEVKHVTYATVPTRVQRFNEGDVQDEHFSYRAEYETEQGAYRNTRSVYLVIEERGGQGGATLAELEGGESMYQRALEAADPDSAWVSFLVDGESIDLFRRARALAVAGGFAVGWDPAALTFPYRSCVVGCAGTGAIGLAAGPQTG